MRVLGTVAAVMVLSLTSIAQATGTPDARADLSVLQQRLAQAWLAGDRATVERIIAPDWIVTGVDGTQATRADVYVSR